MKRGYIHLDGNHLNFASDNLFEVNIDELREFHKQKHQKLHPDYVKAVIAGIRLKLKIKELEATDAESDE